ncbi:MAG: CRISPR-associated endonuclease Cas2 [Pseudomonadota bacterium]
MVFLLDVQRDTERRKRRTWQRYLFRDHRRTRLAKILLDYGDRVQYSVFECLLDGPLLGDLVSGINGVIESGEDSVRIYSLCGACEKVVQVLGRGEVSKEEDVYIV